MRLPFFGLLVVASLLQPLMAQPASENDFAGPIKIVRLLWNANPKSAAGTLTRAIDTALERQQRQPLATALQPLESLVSQVAERSEASDPRSGPAIAALVLLHPEQTQLLIEALDRSPSLSDRELLFRTLLAVDQPAALAQLATALTAAQQESQWTILAVRESLRSDAPAATRIVLAQWPKLAPSVQAAAIEPLSSSAASMSLLLDAVLAGNVNKDLINTNQLRKWLAAENGELVDKIHQGWGTIRETDNQERQALVQSTLKLLRSGVSGSASRGQIVFNRVCAQCHQLHGQGQEVGPNITGNGRGNLEQLVSNVLDPSLVIGEAFQAKTVLTVDGEVVAGLVAAENDRYLKIKVQGGKVIEFDKEQDIEQVKASSKSLMPEGLEAQLKEQEMIDLFAFLCLLKPVGSEDNELIPGSPDDFVTP